MAEGGGNEDRSQIMAHFQVKIGVKLEEANTNSTFSFYKGDNWHRGRGEGVGAS